jgi:photosystem II stability/assembly factor-like uncharacterized protein
MSLGRSGWQLVVVANVIGLGLVGCSDNGRTIPESIVEIAKAVTTPNWENLGPAPTTAFAGGQGFSGRINGVAADPSNPNNHWLIAGEAAGIWETFDGGNTWAPRTDQQASMSCGNIAFAPSSPNIVLAGTGGRGVGGLLKSTDGGTTWTLINQAIFAPPLAESPKARDIRIHPTNPNTVVAALFLVFGDAHMGIHRSTDGGVNWTRTLGGMASSLEVDPGNFNRQLAGIGLPSSDNSVLGVYRSFDAGVTWALVNGPWNALGVTGGVQITVSASNGNLAYVTAATSSGQGVWRTSNAWDPTPTWTAIPGLPEEPQDMRVDPANSNVVYAGGFAHLFRFDGTSWQDITFNGNGTHVDQHQFFFVGNRLLIGNDGGIFSTTNGGQSYFDHNTATLSSVECVRGAIHPTNRDFMITGTFDNGNVKRVGTTLTWTGLIGGDGFADNISSTRPDTDWELSFNNFQGQVNIWRTLDGGQSFQLASNGIDQNNPPFFFSLEKSPNDDNTFVAGSGTLWKTTNFFGVASPTWAANSPAEGNTINAISFAKTDTTSRTYAYGVEDGTLKMTTVGGGTSAANWKNLDPNNQVANRPVVSMAFDPKNANVLYVGLAGFDETTPGQPGHLFKTTNALAASPTWTRLGPTLNLPFFSVAVDPINSQVVYLGTNQGLYKSLDGGATFTHADDMPNVSVSDIRTTTAGTVAAFTNGRGVWRQIQQVPSSNVPNVPRAVQANTGSIVIGSGSLVDSYRSCAGAYGGTNVRSNGNVQAGTTITNNGTVRGALFPNSPGGLSPFPVPAGLVSSGDLTVNNGQTVTLAAGDYLYRNINLNSGGTLATSGRVRIWFTGSANLSGRLTPAGNLPANAWLFSTTATISANINAGAQVTGVIYTPNIALSPGNVTVLGGLVDSTGNLNGTQVHYDEVLGGATCP